jgi:hypothetical protein
MGINSKYHHITNHTQLMHTIMHVNASRVEQEEEMKFQLKEIYYSFQPATLVKNALKSALHNPETQKTLAQTALSIGTDFLISKFFKKGSSMKGFVSSVVLEKVADFALNGKSELINNSIQKLGGLFKKFKS